MELKLKLQIGHGKFIPINYQYEIASWIYKVINRADVSYSTFLHEKGYQAEGRNFKMFTFSQLDLRPYQPKGEYVELLGKEISLTVRFLIDTSFENFVKGLFLNQQFSLGDRIHQLDLQVSSVETSAAPEFKPLMQYQCLSPICISQARGDGTAEYLNPTNKNFGERLVQNLINKEKALQTVVPHTTNPIVEDKPMPSYRFRLQNEPRKKGIHIKAHTQEHTQLIGYLFHFELLAPPELHEIGYYAGFGEKNSMGFGCVEPK